MKRTAVIIRTSEDGKRCIAVDCLNIKVILDYVRQDERHQKKFRHICDIILKGYKIRELYDKEEIDVKSKGVRAMKFFKGRDNDRIYCREITMGDKIFVVIASELLKGKKTQKISPRVKNIIHKVASYEYTIEHAK